MASVGPITGQNNDMTISDENQLQFLLWKLNWDWGARVGLVDGGLRCLYLGRPDYQYLHVFSLSVVRLSNAGGPVPVLGISRER